MRALGNYLMRGRLQAIGVVATLTVASWFLTPLAFVISGAPVGLITLRRGGAFGAQVMAGSLVSVMFLGLVAGIPPAFSSTFVLGIWIPVWLCSMVLRATESQGALVLAGGVLGMTFVAAVYALVGDAGAWWHAWFTAWFTANLPGEAGSRYLEILQSAKPLLNAMMAAALVASLILTILIARWWQALLFFPGAFRLEFYQLRLPRTLAALTLMAIVILLVTEGLVHSVLLDLLFVSLIVYLFQGVSAVHRMVAGRGMSAAWLAGMYGLLLLVPQMFLFVACIGMVDSWLGGASGHRGGL